MTEGQLLVAVTQGFEISVSLNWSIKMNLTLAVSAFSCLLTTDLPRPPSVCLSSNGVNAHHQHLSFFPLMFYCVNLNSTWVCDLQRTWQAARHWYVFSPRRRWTLGDSPSWFQSKCVYMHVACQHMYVCVCVYETISSGTHIICMI